MTKIAIIPARGGSTRVPLKNIREFHGIPMLSRTISVLKDSGCFDRIVVSTDHPEIARIARECGAEAPFVRSEELSKNATPTVEVVANAIEILDFDDNDDNCIHHLRKQYHHNTNTSINAKSIKWLVYDIVEYTGDDADIMKNENESFDLILDKVYHHH
jgi:CMP-N-acetylneuraminic acid synthetase